MTWWNSLFVIYLIAVLSPITVQNVTGESRTSEVDNPTKEHRRESCVGEDCPSHSDFSGSGQSRGEVKGTETAKLSDEKEKRLGGHISRLVHKVFEPRSSMQMMVQNHPVLTDPGQQLNRPVLPGGRAFRMSSLGVALISYHGEGLICTGVHLRPWILVTVGDCVSGRDVKDLFVTVTMRLPNGTHYRLNTYVESVTFAPGYHTKKSDNNLAIVQIYGRLDWNVEHFELPRMSTTPANILLKNPKTYTNEWLTTSDEAYFASYVPASVQLNYLLCKALPLFLKWYCVESKGRREVLNELDIGGPFFYKTGEIKRLTGIYMGDRVDEVIRAYLFHAIEPHLQFLDDFLYNHPMPPNFLPPSRTLGHTFFDRKQQ